MNTDEISKLVALANYLFEKTTGKPLDILQKFILKEVVGSGKNLNQIKYGNYSKGHINNVATTLWRNLKESSGKRVTIKTVKEVLIEELNKQESIVASKSQTPATAQGEINALVANAYIVDLQGESNNYNNTLVREKLVIDFPFDCSFYLERPSIESQCYETLLQPGALLRIKAPQQMGKTLLINKVFEGIARGKDYRVANVILKLADNIHLKDLDQFLRWLCTNVSHQLELPAKLDEFWNKQDFGSKVSCTTYFEKYLLNQEKPDLILCLDDVDLLFPHPDIYEDFFPLLRSWHERANSHPIWRKLRLVVVHSTDIYIKLNIDKSPFNVGVTIEVPEFSLGEVQEFAKRHGFDWDNSQVEQITQMVGGHPYLVRLAISHLKNCENTTLAKLLETAPTEMGIYSSHLREHLSILKQNSALATAFKKVIATKNPVRLETLAAYKLQSKGFVKRQGNEITVSCELYRLYFQERLGEF